MKTAYFLIACGIILNTIRLSLSHFFALPESFSGLVSGFASSILIVGAFRLIWMRTRVSN